MKIGKIDINGKLSWFRVTKPGFGVLLEDDFVLADWMSHSPQNQSEFRFQNEQLQPPVVPGAKVICIGKNYADHAAEMGGSPPELPIVFSKFFSSINAPFRDVTLPVICQQLDFEAELVVVIGKAGKNIEPELAKQHVLGYMCGNDFSARDWQKGRPGGQWLLGKSFDTFAPVGPWITCVDEVSHPENLDITLRLNGNTMQHANTGLLIYPIDFLISHLSKFFTLEVGDLIFTGTPSGVGAGRNPPLFLKPDDIVEVEISGLGSIKNRIIAEQERLHSSKIPAAAGARVQAAE